MRIIHTHSTTQRQLRGVEKDWVYNGLDACITHEVLDALLPQLNKYTERTYEFSKDLQAPVLDMRMRGVKVDLYRKEEVLKEYDDALDKVEADLERIVREGCDIVGFNWRSYISLRELFYDILQIPVITAKGGRPTVNRAALEKMNQYPIAQFFVKSMIRMRELKKRIDVLKTSVDPDGRMRTSYNIAGTSTGRFSSSFSEFGTGTNFQNIEESLRSIFIADPGMKLANFDAEQGESRCVGAIEWNLFRRGTYLDACESGDLHTTVARICWPELPWPNTLEGQQKLAEQKFYRHHSRRHMCKVLGHGTNYGGQPQRLSAETTIGADIIINFQRDYFKAFPDHRAWHAWVEEQIRTHGKLVSLSGRLRQFFGRRDADDTIRDAIAYDPQCSLSDIVNRGMIQVCRAEDYKLCQLLMQNHDSILVQYPQEKEDEIVPKILKHLEYPIQLRDDRTLLIPYGCKTGWNWGEFSEANPDGLKKYQPNDKRTRTPEVHFLDRKLR